MAAFNATFTLPGIAGIVLTIGCAVDANVLIFERLREEQHRGLSLRMALRNAYDRAFSAILDSNVTTVITAADPLLARHRGSEGLRPDAADRLICELVHRPVRDQDDLRHPDRQGAASSTWAACR